MLGIPVVYASVLREDFSVTGELLSAASDDHVSSAVFAMVVHAWRCIWYWFQRLPGVFDAEPVWKRHIDVSDR